MDCETNVDLKENVNNTQRFAPSTLEVERLRMQMTMKKSGVAGSDNAANVDTVGEIPTMPSQRGVRRFKSSNPNMVVSRNASGPLAAPTRSTDAAASLRGSAVARANSSRNLLQRATSSNSTTNPLTRNGIPARTTSSQGLRSYNKDQIVNSSISRKPSTTDGILNMHIRGPGGTLGLQRNESEMSLGEFSISDGSLFTTDSVFVRKSQCNIADPIDNDETHTYYDDDSFADHESFMTRDTDAHLLYEIPARNNNAPSSTADAVPSQSQKAYGSSSSGHVRRPEQPPSAIKAPMTLDDLESLKLSRLHINSSSGAHHNMHGAGAGDDISLISYGTMASGLTTDYTDHDFTDGYNIQEQAEEE
jgi:hypothetical protein